MNNKGQITGVLVMLVIGIIGLVVLSDFTTGFCNCTPDSISKTLLVDVWNNDTCVGDKCSTDWSVVCNDTELEAGTEYDIDDCNVELTNATWNNTACTLYYTYEGDTYTDGITSTIVCMLPVFIALALMMIAVGWFALR